MTIHLIINRHFNFSHVFAAPYMVAMNIFVHLLITFARVSPEYLSKNTVDVSFYI